MKQLTDDRPKPMLLLAGKPILEHVLDRLRSAGVQEVLLVTGYRADMVEAHFANYPIPVHFVRQQVINGTGAAAMLARDFVGRDSFFLTFGDILASAEDYADMAARFTADEDAVASLGVKFVDDPWQGAAVYEEGGRVVRIIEKPRPGTSTTHWNSAGLYAFRGEPLFAELTRIPVSPRGEYELTSAISQLVESGQRVLLQPLTREWRDIGRPEDLKAAERLI